MGESNELDKVVNKFIYESDKVVCNLDDLVVDKVFDELEIIIHVGEKNLDTITNMTGIESGKEYNLRVHHYDLIKNKENVEAIYNGCGEVFEDDENYSKYQNKLVQAGLWRED